MAFYSFLLSFPHLIGTFRINIYMALKCTSITALEVTGSDYPDVNGIYYPFEDTLDIFPEGDIWVKNNVNDLIRIINSSGSSWSVAYRTGLGPQNAPLFFKDGSTDCPQLGQYTVGDFGEGYTEPTVSEYIVPVVEDVVDVRNNKYTTSTEAGAVRFRRLIGLGYV